ncbi:hypothetical protein F5Y17DRAFT_115071 [Xylariaceae sp. FL0594]|nr:hypothetical protein F5Y17DRAFT_115071 [Xylariaceae sp. FL0594]
MVQPSMGETMTYLHINRGLALLSFFWLYYPFVTYPIVPRSSSSSSGLAVASPLGLVLEEENPLLHDGAQPLGHLQPPPVYQATGDGGGGHPVDLQALADGGLPQDHVRGYDLGLLAVAVAVLAGTEDAGVADSRGDGQAQLVELEDATARKSEYLTGRELGCGDGGMGGLHDFCFFVGTLCRFTYFKLLYTTR